MNHYGVNVIRISHEKERYWQVTAAEAAAALGEPAEISEHDQAIAEGYRDHSVCGGPGREIKIVRCESCSEAIIPDGRKLCDGCQRLEQDVPATRETVIQELVRVREELVAAKSVSATPTLEEALRIVGAACADHPDRALIPSTFTCQMIPWPDIKTDHEEIYNHAEAAAILQGRKDSNPDVADREFAEHLESLSPREQQMLDGAAAKVESPNPPTSAPSGPNREGEQVMAASVSESPSRAFLHPDADAEWTGDESRVSYYARVRNGVLECDYMDAWTNVIWQKVNECRGLSRLWDIAARRAIAWAAAKERSVPVRRKIVEPAASDTHCTWCVELSTKHACPGRSSAFYTPLPRLPEPPKEPVKCEVFEWFKTVMSEERSVVPRLQDLVLLESIRCEEARRT